MKHHILSLFFPLLLLSVSCRPSVEVVWTEEPASGSLYAHTLTVRNLPPSVRDWTVWFSMPYRKNLSVDPASTAVLEEMEANFYRIVPAEGSGRPEGDSVRIRYTTTSPTSFEAWAPEGFSFQKGDGKPRAIPVRCRFLPLEEDAPRVARGQAWVRYVEPAPEAMIPALKRYAPAPGNAFSVPEGFSADTLSVSLQTGRRDGWYALSIGEDGIRASASGRSGVLYARETLRHLLASSGGLLAPADIEDWPDFSYRGLMLDPARHFLPTWKLKELMRIMVRYKLNVLHLRLSDDDGWRMEIPAIPELSEVGGHRAVPVRQADGTYAELDAIQPSYDGTFSREDTTRLANGFYTKDDFVSLLRFADSLCIRVVPEIDLPGHSRAAIKALEAYARRTGDGSLALTDPQDSSRYRSAQGYYYNTMDPGLEGTYRVIAAAFDGILDVYRAAGLPLESLHVGGDEVPKGVWMGSPSCHRVLEKAGFDVSRIAPYASVDEKSLTEEQRAARDEAKVILRSRFVGRVLDLAAERGLRLSGWHELVRHLDPETRSRLCAQTGWINYWGSNVLRVHEMANEGFPVVISNGRNTYADEAYSAHRREFGNIWAGPVDEKRTFALLPFDLYRSERWDFQDNDRDLEDPGRGKPALLRPENILGVQVQLFMGAAVRRYSDVEYMLFPKALGAFDRAWNARPDWSENAADRASFRAAFSRFYSTVVTREMPWYRSRGIRFHLPQPVLRFEDGLLTAYTPIPGAVVRYETDGGAAEVTEHSVVLDGPVRLDPAVRGVRACLFHEGMQSVPTVLRITNE